MNTTRVTLIGKVKDPRDHIAWQEFYDIYRPLILRYARQRGLPQAEAEDLVGQCFAELSKAMPQFDYEPQKGRFKSWLKTLVTYKVINLLRERRESLLTQSALERSVPVDDDGEEDWERAWQNELLGHCMRQVRSEVTEEYYQIFRLNVLDEIAAEEVGRLFGLSAEQVYRIKYKVLQRIREKMQPYHEKFEL